MESIDSARVGNKHAEITDTMGTTYAYSALAHHSQQRTHHPIIKLATQQPFADLGGQFSHRRELPFQTSEAPWRARQSPRDAECEQE